MLAIKINFHHTDFNKKKVLGLLKPDITRTRGTNKSYMPHNSTGSTQKLEQELTF